MRSRYTILPPRQDIKEMLILGASADELVSLYNLLDRVEPATKDERSIIITIQAAITECLFKLHHQQP